MPSFHVRGPNQIQAAVRLTGTRKQTKTFETLEEAENWAYGVEADIRRGTFVDRRAAQRVKFRQILLRYERDVLPTKRGADAERPRIRALMKHHLADKWLADLGPQDFSSYRDERLRAVGPGSVLRELGLISSVLTCAIKDWGYPIENPIPKLRRPAQPEKRSRRLTEDEEGRLLDSARASQCRAPQLADAIVLAIETGMRAGEIVGLSRASVNLNGHYVTLRQTKNGSSRIVPLTAKAEAVLRKLCHAASGEKLFSFYDTRGLSAAFRRARKRAGIEDLTFHDLRHEAASRLSARIPSPSLLAKIMGWRTLQMAMRYYDPTPKEMVEAVRVA